MKFDIPPPKPEGLITMKTAECEGIESVGAWLGDACAARVEHFSQRRRARGENP